jgi:hypothetical protein
MSNTLVRDHMILRLFPNRNMIIFLLHLLVLLAEVHRSCSQDLANLPSCAVRCCSLNTVPYIIADFQTRSLVLTISTGAAVQLSNTNASAKALRIILALHAASVPIAMRPMTRVGSRCVIL